MRRSVVVVIALIIVGAEATVALYVYDNENGQGDWGKPEQPERRPTSELILSASDLGPDWQGSDSSPMNLTGLSYSDLTMSGFNRRSMGANSQSPWY